MAEAERVRVLETGQQSLAGIVAVLDHRVQDVRDSVADLSDKLDRLDEKLDAAAIARVEMTAAATASYKAMSDRVTELEAIRTSFKTAGQWAVTKGGPILAALVAGSALSPAIKAAVTAAFGAP